MNNFFVIANADKDTDFELTRTVCDFLIQKGAVCTYQEKDNFTYNKQRSVGLEFFSS